MSAALMRDRATLAIYGCLKSIPGAARSAPADCHPAVCLRSRVGVLADGPTISGAFPVGVRGMASTA